jgi:Regulator of ribonuclease activity B
MVKEKPEFPDDNIGAVLHSLWEVGDDLSSPREFDFGVVFEEEAAALDFAVALLRQEVKVSFTPAQEGENVCEVCCHPVLVPDHEQITNFESSLMDLAGEYGGALSGWECYIVKK